MTRRHAPFILQAADLIFFVLNNLQEICHSYYKDKILRVISCSYYSENLTRIHVNNQ